MPIREPEEVVVHGEDGAVGDAPGFPRAHRDDAHGTQPSEGAAVVVCCRDRADLLRGALDAIAPTLRPSDELLVVDSATRDSSVAEVAEARGARLLREDRGGLGRARNAGWRATRKPLVVFTDDDCRPSPGWLEAAERALADDRVGAVWGRVVDSAAGGVALSVSSSTEPEVLSLPGDLSAVGHGAVMAFRRAALERIGGFDPVLGAGARFPAGEDKDAFWRVARTGWQVRLAPGMSVVHERWRDDRAAIRTLHRYGLGAAAVAAKRRRLDHEPGLLAQELWRHGLLPAARAVRRGRITEGIATLARAAGVVRGLAGVRRVGLDGELLREDT